jgi:hypothetical protein
MPGAALAFGMAAALVCGPAAEVKDPGAVEVERKEKLARGAYERDEYAVAAIAYEELWNKARVPKYLYNAGLAREGLGHSAHALALWRTYLQQEITPEERTKAEARVEMVKQHMTRTIVAVFPSKVAEVSGILKYQYMGPQPTAQRVALTTSAIDVPRTAERALEIYLDPGTWELTFTPDDEIGKSYREAKATLNVVAGQATRDVQLGLAPVLAVVDVRIVGERPWGDVDVVFRDGMNIEGEEKLNVSGKSAQHKLRVGPWMFEVRRRGRSVQKGEFVVGSRGAPLAFKLVEDKKPLSADAKTRIGLGAGLGGVGLATGVTGAVLLDSARNRTNELWADLDQTKKKGEFFSFEEVYPMFKANNLSGLGGGLVGATLGLWTGAVTGAIRPDSTRAWLAEITIGGMALVGGFVWHIRATDRFVENTYSGSSSQTQSVLGAGLIGLGAGLAGSGIVGFTLNRMAKKNSSRFALRPCSAFKCVGLSVVGRF